MLASSTLSGNDAAVLGALFDPEASLQNHARINLHLQGPYDRASLSKIKAEEKAALLLINMEKPDSIQLRLAMSKLSDIIQKYPKNASAWNNRAQARRMLHDIDGEQTDCSFDLVFSDLAKSIELASPQNAVEMTSPDNAKVLASAHTHRGYLLWKASRPDADTTILRGIDSLRGMTNEQLEELASRDFSMGGRYGNQTAQELAIKTNPYAKLCGSIVKEALQQEVKDYYEQSGVTVL